MANRGGQLLDAFLPHPDCEIAALCDVHEPTLAKANEKVGSGATLYRDFRKLLAYADEQKLDSEKIRYWRSRGRWPNWLIRLRDQFGAA